jgi:hypothetical protein
MFWFKESYEQKWIISIDNLSDLRNPQSAFLAVLQPFPPTERDRSGVTDIWRQAVVLITALRFQPLIIYRICQ